MAADLILSPEAERDVDQVYDWYESQRIGRGEDFMVRLEACFHSIVRSPEMYAEIRKPFRRALIRKYPYAVIYEYRNPDVWILAVFHMSQEPAKLQARLK